MPPLLTTLKDRLSPFWKSAVLQFDRGRQWLMLRQQAAFMSAGLVIVLLLISSGDVPRPADWPAEER
jgi:hypothetical protein